ncbi:glutathione synthase [Chryseobacterium caseinilyticum]|uniref:Glutathione synthase n=1 Tax=Chryseobacterium caseinilyticum TaxID=2771428 RepID=A0ABR8ZC01_9FLAO|nr:glutathione synthase [Chryseobacterium caseinilyticum]MBD8082849.1 glutathione synthase [Chryseobacterium caseinilyticum]
MATVEFKKEDFSEDDFDKFHIEYQMSEIGNGSNLIVETLQDDGTYEVVHTPIRRSHDSIFICFSEPENGRLIFEKEV